MILMIVNQYGNTIKDFYEIYFLLLLSLFVVIVVVLVVVVVVVVLLFVVVLQLWLQLLVVKYCYTIHLLNW